MDQDSPPYISKNKKPNFELVPTNHVDSCDSQDLQFSQEQNERIWLDADGGQSRYEYAYGLPQQTFHEFHSGPEGLGSSQDDELREMILALKKQIAELSNEAKALHARERQKDI
ncbi:hypothetical protein FXO38_29490 [Capsicum annuum]|nr:hypothetical protein FXO38_29490 [Capsicum annuum]